MRGISNFSEQGRSLGIRALRSTFHQQYTKDKIWAEETYPTNPPPASCATEF